MPFFFTMSVVRNPAETTALGDAVTRRLAARDRRWQRAVGPPPTEDHAAGYGDDSPRLLVLLGVFTAAALIVVVVLVAAATLDTWWALLAVLVVHGAMTAASFAGVSFVFSGHLPGVGRHPRVTT